MLKNKTFENSKYHVFKKTFNKKEREIFKLPYFPDRIIQHCILQILEPIWTKSFIKTTYSSIKNRGIYVNATPIVETDTSDNYQYQTKQWFISSDLKGIGSASAGLHTTNLLKTNNKYGTR